MEATTVSALTELLVNILLDCFSLMNLTMAANLIQSIVDGRKREKREMKKACRTTSTTSSAWKYLSETPGVAAVPLLPLPLTSEVIPMEQIINTANQLIAAIVNATFFLVIYETIFYILGAMIRGIAKRLYERFSPFWKRWFQSIKRKKH